MIIFEPIKRTIFFAIPWDTFVLQTYKAIAHSLAPTWNTQIGSVIIKNNQLASDVEMFRNRNKHLYDAFVAGISAADIFIADITNANPNVMLELGIAIQLNKNILIVTSQDYNKLPFDVNHFQINRYKTRVELRRYIHQHLDIFLKIKSQDFGNSIEGEKISLPDRRIIKNELIKLNIPWNLKNFKMRLEYKFISVSNEEDWLGVHIRASYPHITSSELIYVRSTGKFETVTIPSRPEQLIAMDKTIDENNLEDGFTRMEINVDESKLQACTSSKYFDNNSITLESFGAIYLQGNAHNLRNLDAISIDCRNIEIIRLDTTVPTN
jgi:hypothetical protein